MAESVDALVSNTSGAIHPGSIPGLGTESEENYIPPFFLFEASDKAESGFCIESVVISVAFHSLTRLLIIG